MLSHALFFCFKIRFVALTNHIILGENYCNMAKKISIDDMVYVHDFANILRLSVAIGQKRAFMAFP